MKLLGFPISVLILFASLSHGSYTETADSGHKLIFTDVSTEFWGQKYVTEVVQARFPRFWRKWSDNKARQFNELGERTKQLFERCGQESRLVLS